MKKSELRQIIKEEISKVLPSEPTFIDVYNAVRKNHGRRLKGDRDGFTIPYKYGKINLYPYQGRVDIGYESGGSTQDTDTIDYGKALKIVSQSL